MLNWFEFNVHIALSFQPSSTAKMPRGVAQKIEKKTNRKVGEESIVSKKSKAVSRRDRRALNNEEELEGSRRK